jgi:hypothetical protein
MLFYKIEDHQWGTLIPYLIFLNRLPEDYLISGKYPISDISLDQVIIEKLRKL